MENTFYFYIKLLLGLVLIISWTITSNHFLNDRNDRKIYKKVYDSLKITDFPVVSTTRSKREFITQNFGSLELPRGQNYRAIEYDKVVNFFVELNYLIDNLIEELDYNITLPAQSLDTLPFDYNQKERVQEVFIKKKAAQKITELLASDFEKMADYEEGDFFVVQYPDIFNTYLERKYNILSRSDFLKDISSESELSTLIVNYDVIHAIGFLIFLKKELQLIKSELLENLTQLTVELSTAQNKKYYMKYIADYSVVRVGQENVIRFSPITYLDFPSDVEITLNEQPIEVTNGVGRLSFTPTKKGNQDLLLEIKCRDIFTGREVGHKSRKKVYVY